MKFEDLTYFSTEICISLLEKKNEVNMILLLSDHQPSEKIFLHLDLFLHSTLAKGVYIYTYRSEKEVYAIIEKQKEYHPVFVIISPFKKQVDVQLSNAFASDKINIGYQRHLLNQQDVDHYHHLSLGQLNDNIDDCEVFLRDKESILIDLSVCKRSEIPENNNAKLCGLFAEDLCKISKFAGAGLKKKLIIISGYSNSHISSTEAELVSTALWYIKEGMNDKYYENPLTSDLRQIIVSISDDMDITFFESQNTNRYWVKLSESDTPIPCTEREFLRSKQKDLSMRLLNS